MASTTPEQSVLAYIRKVVEGASGSKPVSTILPLSLLLFLPARSRLKHLPWLLCAVTCEPHKLFLPLVVFLSVFCPKKTTTYPHTLLNALTTRRHLVVHENFPNKITGPFHR